MSKNRPKLFASGNHAVGFLAIGNVATGVIAFGNLARGVIAVGNLAVGVVAFGNVGFGVLVGGGATVGVGLLGFSAILGLGVLGSGTLMPFDAAVPLSFLPPVAWLIASFAFRGRCPPAPDLPVFTPIAEVERDGGHGWVRARLVSGTLVSGTGDAIELTLVDGDQTLHPAVAPQVRDRALGALDQARRMKEDPVDVAAHLRAREELDPSSDAAGYRDAADTRLAIHCDDLRIIPARPPIWSDSAHIQWYIAWVWRVAAPVGFVLAVLHAFGHI